MQVMNTEHSGDLEDSFAQAADFCSLSLSGATTITILTVSAALDVSGMALVNF